MVKIKKIMKETIKSMIEYLKKEESEKFVYEDKKEIKGTLFISVIITLLAFIYTIIYGKSGYSQFSSHRSGIRGVTGYIKAIINYLGDSIGAFIICITFLVIALCCITWLNKKTKTIQKTIKSNK